MHYLQVTATRVTDVFLLLFEEDCVGTYGVTFSCIRTGFCRDVLRRLFYWPPP
jgi:hypothetical protein